MFDKKDNNKNVDLGKVPERIFSKTYRKLFLKVDNKIVLENDVECIKFYGHSLSRGDYSYFQSIFDYYNIYDYYIGSDREHRRVKLEFYFSFYNIEKDKEKFSDETKTKLKADYADKVYKLLHEYGRSMDNQDKGKNLIHKLLLENRLSIKEIE